MSLGTLAIVGAPSVGKSTIFNRIVGERRSIVEEERGITRDRLYAKATWLTKDFTVIDTGGIQLKNAPFQEEIRAQVEIALEEADVILFLVDGKTGLTGDDNFIAKLLYRSNKPVLLGVNKSTTSTRSAINPNSIRSDSAIRSPYQGLTASALATS